MRTPTRPDRDDNFPEIPADQIPETAAIHPARYHGLPVVAIVGRPNVGKSTLYNRILGRRKAVVHDLPGVTRDRNIDIANWDDTPFVLIDTGGFDVELDDPLIASVVEQARLAMDQADAIVLVFAAGEVSHPADVEMVRILRAAGKPLFAVVNKCDNPNSELEANEFFRFGFEQIYPLSALHGRGIADLVADVLNVLPERAVGLPEFMTAAPAPPAAEPAEDEADDTAYRRMALEDETEDGPLAQWLDEWEGRDEVEAEVEPAGDAETEAAEEESDENKATAAELERRRRQALDRPLALAIVGRQNVGKSTLVNQLTGTQRVIASPLPGTTRDAIDSYVTAPSGRPFILIDTAGIRRRGKIERGIEKLSVTSAFMSLRRADVAAIIIDAVQGITEQDAHIAGYCLDVGLPTLIVVNKWDAVEKDNMTADHFTKQLEREWAFMRYAPVLYISGLTGQRARRIYDIAERIWLNAVRRIPTHQLNEHAAGWVTRRPPVMKRNRRPKVRYLTQTGVAPPTFTMFVNDPQLFHFSYIRYLTNRIRETWDFEGTPLKVQLRRSSGRKGAGQYVIDKD